MRLSLAAHTYATVFRTVCSLHNSTYSLHNSTPTWLGKASVAAGDGRRPRLI